MKQETITRRGNKNIWILVAVIVGIASSLLWPHIDNALSGNENTTGNAENSSTMENSEDDSSDIDMYRLLPPQVPPESMNTGNSYIPENIFDENSSSSSLTGFFLGQLEQEGNDVNEGFAMPSEPQFQDLMQLAELMKNPAYQAFSKEFAKAAQEEIAKNGNGNMFDIMMKISKSKKFIEITKKYAKDPEFMKAMEQIKKASGNFSSYQNINDFGKSSQHSSQEDDSSDYIPSEQTITIVPSQDKSIPGQSTGAPFEE